MLPILYLLPKDMPAIFGIIKVLRSCWSQRIMPCMRIRERAENEKNPLWGGFFHNGIMYSYGSIFH